MGKAYHALALTQTPFHDRFTSWALCESIHGLHHHTFRPDHHPFTGSPPSLHNPLPDLCQSNTLNYPQNAFFSKPAPKSLFDVQLCGLRIQSVQLRNKANEEMVSPPGSKTVLGEGDQAVAVTDVRSFCRSLHSCDSLDLQQSPRNSNSLHHLPGENNRWSGLECSEN